MNPGLPSAYKLILWSCDSVSFRSLLSCNLIQITLTMPINFVVNKLWTFRAVRGKRLHPEQELPMVAAVVAPEVATAAVSLLDRAARKGLIHKNKAARHKSQLARKAAAEKAAAEQATAEQATAEQATTAA